MIVNCCIDTECQLLQLHSVRDYLWQVCVQLPTSADNASLPALAVARRAAGAAAAERRAAIDRHLLLAGSTAANPQQQRAAGEWDRQSDGWTDAWQLHRPCSAY